MKNKNAARGGAARGETKTRRQRFDVSTRKHTTRFFVRQLSNRAFEIARRCERVETKRKFQQVARFLARRARGETTR